MPIRCEIIPREDATPDQLRQLASAILRWYNQEVRGEGATRRIDQHGLTSLQAGKLPDALALGAVAGPDEPDPELDRHAVAIVVRGGPAYDRKAVIASFRRDLSPELVQDVLVAGRSWNLLD